MSGSPPGKLDRRDVGQAFWLAFFVAAASGLTFLAEQLGKYDLGQIEPLIVMTLVWLASMARSWVADNQVPPARSRAKKKGA